MFTMLTKKEIKKLNKINEKIWETKQDQQFENLMWWLSLLILILAITVIIICSKII
jgi:hypothetical protein